MKNITRDEIKDAMQRYIADGGKIEKIKFKDNGMLLNNDLMLDRNFDNESNVLEELQADSIFEPEVVNWSDPMTTFWSGSDKFRLVSLLPLRQRFSFLYPDL